MVVRFDSRNEGAASSSTQPRLPTLAANGTYIRRLLADACENEEKNKNPLDEETGHTLRQWRIGI